MSLSIWHTCAKSLPARSTAWGTQLERLANNLEWLAFLCQILQLKAPNDMPMVRRRNSSPLM